MSNVNDVTLEYFTNPTYQFVLDKLGKGVSKGPNKGMNNILNKGDHKFYRKRIAALIKEMNRGKFPSDELMTGYHAFAALIIEHFKVMDKCEILQEQYTECDKDLAETDGAGCDGDVGGNGDGDGDGDLVQQLFELFDVSNNMNDVSFNIIQASQPMMKKCIQPATLDNYVTIQRTEDNNTTRVIPVQMQIDLRDVKFKTKGLKSKKEVTKTDEMKLLKDNNAN